MLEWLKLPAYMYLRHVRCLLPGEMRLLKLCVSDTRGKSVLKHLDNFQNDLYANKWVFFIFHCVVMFK